MNIHQQASLLKDKIQRQEMVSRSKQEEDKRATKIAKEKEQAEERQRRAESRAPRSKGQEENQQSLVEAAKTFRSSSGKEPNEPTSGSRAILEALTRALDNKNGPAARRLIGEFNNQYGSMVAMEYDEPVKTPSSVPRNTSAPNAQQGQNQQRVDDSSQLLAAISGEGVSTTHDT
ncbi:uncharacterized protein MELLADRAFT_106490 [Melampsora larici-populina 98AG31]|uniref:Uncharacterized protein n=1 Tax=Melampsora larici-populina (strain 98AG31 / pathotype 3-4-7) TaxID=747676 RepID=F4RLP0_MELLP|nr:uncharacterized protein MELLADRAFT_106490 [Melampsora larici-populina 98AG31]EGG06716.1 hypothetical protein MELLADRAFT_106490 [Melampsora larici-populina 98AG31]